MNRDIKAFLWRGLAAGASGGLAAAVFLRLVTETQIGFALQFEDAVGIGAPAGDPPEFSRFTQQIGGMAAAIIYGAVLGLILGFTVAALHHRLAGRNEFQRVAKVAGAAFVAVVLIPAVKYPPNPPAVGDPDTISQRTWLYLTLLAASIAIVFGAWYFWQFLTARGFDGGARFLIGGGALFVAITLAYVIWPASPDPIVPPDNESAPALEVASTAPGSVLDRMLSTAKETGDESIRDPHDPTQPMDLNGITDGEDLKGAPVAVSTTKLVAHAYTTVVWHFRIDSIGGLALMWAVMAGMLGLLLDRATGDSTSANGGSPRPTDPERVGS